MYHFHRDDCEDRVLEVWERPDVTTWVEALHRQFARWIKIELPKIVESTFPKQDAGRSPLKVPCRGGLDVFRNKKKLLLRGASAYVLGIAVAITLYWYSRARNFEALVSLLVLIATVTGTLVDRWVAEGERRRALLRALGHEVYMNLQAIDSQHFKEKGLSSTPVAYPRAYMTALQAVISSGAFLEARDAELAIRLHSWLQRAGELNQRLLITEIRTFTHPDPTEVLQWRTKLVRGRVLKAAREGLLDLARHLMDHYSSESGIDRTTVLFSGSEAAGKPEDV